MTGWQIRVLLVDGTEPISFLMYSTSPPALHAIYDTIIHRYPNRVSRGSRLYPLPPTRNTLIHLLGQGETMKVVTDLVASLQSDIQSDRDRFENASRRRDIAFERLERKVEELESRNAASERSLSQQNNRISSLENDRSEAREQAQRRRRDLILFSFLRFLIATLTEQERPRRLPLPTAHDHRVKNDLHNLIHNPTPILRDIYMQQHHSRALFSNITSLTASISPRERNVEAHLEMEPVSLLSDMLVLEDYVFDTTGNEGYELMCLHMLLTIKGEREFDNMVDIIRYSRRFPRINEGQIRRIKNIPID